MAGISSKAAGKLENKYKFNDGTELNNDFDISLYETNWRLYDPQIGRFHQIDKLGELNNIVSGYVFASNNPISINDPDGLSDTLRVRKDGEIEYGEKGKATTLDEVVITQNTRDRANQGNISFYENASLLRYRFNNGLPLLQKYDRESFKSGLGDGSLVKQIERELDAESFEREYYLMLSSAVTLPGDVVAVVGLTHVSGKALAAMVGGMEAISLRLAIKNSIALSKVLVDKGGFTAHGNSLKSLIPTWGYKLYSADGIFLKNGITSKVIPEARYSKAFMLDKKMVPFKQFSNRLEAYQWEFGQNQIIRGPLNRNMH